MPLSEPQIRRYARHILLPEVGGVGQERLLATEVHVSGAPMGVELACDFLRAAGVICDAHSGEGGLCLRIVEGPSVIARASEDEIAIVSSACPACAGEAKGEWALAPGMIAASLAASECLRLALGLGEVDRAWRVCGSALSAMPFTPCPAHSKAP